MSLAILGAGVFKAEELATFAMPPAWRKATRNMVMATASLERALNQLAGRDLTGDPRVGFVLSTASGELETSVDFIATFAKSGLARPVLFQNSLHNATTGFASIHFKLTGPVFTLSSLESSPKDALEMAETLLEAGACHTCLVTLVEGHKALARWMQVPEVGEGACTLVLTTESEAARTGWKVRGRLPASEFPGLNFNSQPERAPLLSVEESGIFRLATELGAEP